MSHRETRLQPRLEPWRESLHVLSVKRRNERMRPLDGNVWGGFFPSDGAVGRHRRGVYCLDRTQTRGTIYKYTSNAYQGVSTCVQTPICVVATVKRKMRMVLCLCVCCSVVLIGPSFRRLRRGVVVRNDRRKLPLLLRPFLRVADFHVPPLVPGHGALEIN